MNIVLLKNKLIFFNFLPFFSIEIFFDFSIKFVNIVCLDQS